MNTEGLKDEKAGPEAHPTFPGAGVTHLPAGAADSDCPLVQGSNLLDHLKDGDRYEWNRHLWLNGEPALAQVSEVYGWQGDSQVIFQVAH